MSFSDRPLTAQEQDAMQNTIGNSPTGYIGGVLFTLIAVGLVIVAAILIVRYVKKYKLTGTAARNRQFYVKLDKKPMWRLTNVIYWSIVCISMLIAFVSTDQFGNSLYVGYGLLIAILSYPGYLGLKRTVAYVFNASDTIKK